MGDTCAHSAETPYVYSLFQLWRGKDQRIQHQIKHKTSLPHFTPQIKPLKQLHCLLFPCLQNLSTFPLKSPCPKSLSSLNLFLCFKSFLVSFVLFQINAVCLFFFLTFCSSNNSEKITMVSTNILSIYNKKKCFLRIKSACKNDF